MVNCIFSEPVYFNPSVNQLIPLDNDVLKTTNWNFTKMACSGDLNFSTSSIPAYISTTTLSDFYVQKTFTYGEISLLAFLIPAVFIILAFGIRKILSHKFING